MSIRYAKFVAPLILSLAAGPAFAAGHGGGGHGGGGHVGGGHVGGYHGGYVGGYHAGYGGYHAGYGGYRGGYYGGYRGYGYGGYGYGLGGYGLGYGGYGYGLGGYGLGYGGYGGYGGYSYPYNYSYPSTYGDSYYPSVTPVSGSIIQASGSAPASSTTSAVAAPATVTVMVPSNAQVWFDGKEATASGDNRVFSSPDLQPGASSVVTVKARWNGNDRTMRLPIQAGDKMKVDLRESN